MRKNLSPPNNNTLPSPSHPTQNLLVLNLAANEISDQDVGLLMVLLRAMPRLRELDLTENDLGESTLRGLAILAKQALAKGSALPLQVLRLSENSLGIRGTTALAELIHLLPNLKELHADGVEMRNEGVATLARAVATHKTLQVLSLADNFIEADGATHLANALAANHKLVTLDLQANDIVAAGARAIAAALSRNASLRTLCLWDNRVGDQGAQAFADMLRTNKTLEVLDLKFNCLNSDGVRALAEALPVRTDFCLCFWQSP